jgi:Zn-finger nucleic acid-binding protein
VQVGYRNARQCPQCRALLSELSTTSAIVDRCPDCGGLWIDWFDGEISAVAASARRLPQTDGASGDGTSSCPDCRTTLSAVRYPDDQRGAEILRCGSCAGAFVPRGSLEVVIALGPPPDPKSETRSSRLGMLWLELRRLFAAE